jgi:3-oxoacyl-[acyl-carrier protein] reductase
VLTHEQSTHAQSTHAQSYKPVAAVTGSSSGIGRAIALSLAAGGADIVVHARRNLDAANETASRVRAAGAKAFVVLGDIAEPEARTALVEAAWNWQGRVNYWINNAGADVLTGEAASWPFEKKLERLWQVDVAGTIGLSRLVGQRLLEQFAKESSALAESAADMAILNMGWDQAETGMGGDSGQFFAAAKGSVMAFTKSLARTLAPHIRVNCLAPGWIQTAWGEGASTYWQERARRESLLGRWGSPEDVAQAAAYLCSPNARFVTGQVLNINGGYRGEWPAP